MNFKPRKHRMSKKRKEARADGYRSGLEKEFHKAFPDLAYEPSYFEYTLSETRKYYPDFVSPDGNTWFETKGMFSAEDRKKMVLVQEQYPSKRIVMVFEDPNRKLTKAPKSKTYAQWCDRYGFEWMDMREIKRGLVDKKFKGR